MPLKSGSDEKTVLANYKELRRAGYEEDQAWAIAYDKARDYETNKRKRKRSSRGSRKKRK